jgi:hypothetical protein
MNGWMINRWMDGGSLLLTIVTITIIIFIISMTIIIIIISMTIIIISISMTIIIIIIISMTIIIIIKGPDGKEKSDMLTALAEDHLNDVFSNVAAMCTMAVSQNTIAVGW